MLVNGDKLVVTKGIVGILEEGEIVQVVDVNENGLISFAFGEGLIHKGLMNELECEEHFEKYVEPEPEMVLPQKVTTELVEEIIDNSNIEMYTAFGRCTIVTCELPNGFILVEYSPCMSEEDYSEEIGFNNCMGKIREKIWELESYVLKDAIYYNELENGSDCNECELREECYCRDEEHDDDYEDDHDCWWD